MPKCKLKPWIIDEPQTVFISKDGERRIVVSFIQQDGKCIRLVSPEVIYIDVNTLEISWCEGYGTRCLSEVWTNDIVDSLGIPETIEVENEPEN
jgi:hypothetical protein